ncbi:MAG TPA: STAS/SEC14 domain-containing protein, partial [Desulfobaccales bacterium]
AAGGSARLLLCLEENFEGWDTEAIRDEALRGSHQENLEKVAVVGGSWWTRLEIRLGASLLAGEVETFSSDELAEAWEWIKT